MQKHRQIHDKLLQWYKKEGRHDLPWRNTDKLYHIYLSEVMLQQTQVNRVMDEYYPQFLKKFPTLKALANAKEEEVLSAWSGLGYYSRARNLHKTAKLIATQGLPQDEKELQKLPGIGRYTASAICCFGKDHSIPVVDTNIKRVLKRYFALLHVKDETVWKKAKLFVNPNDPRSHNLALMDLGSLICTAKNPKCHLCPLESSCLGKNEAELYTKTQKKQYIQKELFFGILIKDNKIALTHSTNGMYKGLLVFPDVDPIEENLIGSYKHSYTKYRLHVNLYSIENFSGKKVWIELKNFDTAHTSSLVKKAKKFL